MNLTKSINSLCRPAYLYLVVSIVVIIGVTIQNLMNRDMNKLCVGTFSCNVTNVIVILVMKFLSIIFWTVILDALCKYGLKRLSWALVLLPYILVLIAVILMG